jgi:hypothetical protein
MSDGASGLLRHVTIKKFAELSGYSEDAIRAKIKRGDWLEGAVFIKAPDGRNLIDLEGYEKWASGVPQHLSLKRES